MAYRLQITTHASRAVRKLPRTILEQAMGVIEELSIDPRPAGCKRLKARSEWSVRIGDYRILYLIDDENAVVTITEAKHRREVYR